MLPAITPVTIPATAPTRSLAAHVERLIVVATVIALILNFYLFRLAHAVTVPVTVCPVDCDFTLLQDAVTAATSSPYTDTILVSTGIYSGTDISITKPLTITGSPH